MRDLIRGVVIGLLLMALLGAIASRTGWATISIPRPEGTGPWMLSRATGVTAFIALSLEVILGLLVSTRTGDRWLTRAHAIDLHGWLSPVTLALVAGHAIVLLADRYVRFDVLDLLVPFASPFRPAAIGLGELAAYLILVVHASFALRCRLGTQTWRRLHYLSFAAFIAASLHAVLAGTDSSHPWLVTAYAIPLVLVSGLVAHRVLASLRLRRQVLPAKRARGAA